LLRNFIFIRLLFLQNISVFPDYFVLIDRYKERHHDTQHINIRHNVIDIDIQHNYIQHYAPNGTESAINRALDGSTYPNENIQPSPL
jgi:hypothetical protein